MHAGIFTQISFALKGLQLSQHDPPRRKRQAILFTLKQYVRTSSSSKPFLLFISNRRSVVFGHGYREAASFSPRQRGAEKFGREDPGAPPEVEMVI